MTTKNHQHKKQKSILLISMLLLTSFAWAHHISCNDLCNKFGDYNGCQRLSAGEVDCTYPHGGLIKDRDNTPNNKNQTPPTKFYNKTDTYWTLWQNRGGIQMRFRLMVGERSFSFVGYSRPELDPYYIKLSPTKLSDDHIIGAGNMSCSTNSNREYICRYTHGYGEYETLKAIYHKNGKRKFDLKIYALRTKSPNAQRGLILHLYSNGRYVIMGNERYKISH